MLIVTRSQQQSVIVGEFDGLELMLKVTVLGVQGTKVRLGFEVMSDDPGPSESWEQISDNQPKPAAKPGMATTEEWEWDWEEDGSDETIYRNHDTHGQVPQPDKKRFSLRKQTDQ